MLPKTLADFGGPYVNAKVVENPESQLDADDGNRAFEDLAQLTRTKYKAIVKFKTHNASPVPTTQVWHLSLWGTGDITKPAVTRAGAGLYTVTYASTLDDSLGYTETVSFFDGHVACRPLLTSSTPDYSASRIDTISGSSADLIVKVGGTLADQDGTDYFYVTAYLI